jgi:tyrosyl-tRNA synthetase
MKKPITDPKIIDAVLERGTIVEILPTKKEFREALLLGKKLRFYIGFDATAPTLHLSHAKNFMLMEKFRRLGHEVIILFGDFTARIGDPTGESAVRKQLTREDVVHNVEQWKKLVTPLMNFDDAENPPKIMYNHDWLAKLTMEDVVSLASNFTVQQILARDMYQKRIQEEKPIHLHEFLYPLMQGYDSVAMDVDVEVCGTDQIFNALAGRTLLKKLKGKDKFVVAVTLMENPKTGELMSKSKGIGVFLDVSPADMYGQVMAQSDEMIEILFINNTLLSPEEIKKIMKAENPRDAKMRLALEIAAMFHGKEAAKKAEEHFIKVIQQKQAPDVAREVTVAGSKINVVQMLVTAELAKSKSDARRLIEQKAIKIDGEIITEDKDIVITAKGFILQKGPRQFVKVSKKTA